MNQSELGEERFWEKGSIPVDVEVSSKIAPPENKRMTRIFVDFWAEGVYHPLTIEETITFIAILQEAVAVAKTFHGGGGNAV